ncbi:hypothetical protein DSO57_1022607 [Entomophthora muscae]|uniref:Uncharacterized protein n=1 Tax=Entomophthora muscae TaxID=34485 RepID=A0ACC2RHP1_9FUNG|nr:hypothetical protein DSO57_1022607 [Entomophthora muscae]
MEDSTFCTAIGFFAVLSNQIYMFLNISIALNLHLIILLCLKPRRQWEAYYWCLSLGAPIILNLPLLGNHFTFLLIALAAGIFGKSAGNFCFIRNGTKFNEILEVVYISGVGTVTIMYCAIVSVAVILKMKKKLSFKALDIPLNCSETSKPSSDVSLGTLIKRTCLYPFTCFVCYFSNNIMLVYYCISSSTPVWLQTMAILGFSSRGMFHLFAFLGDPIVFNALPCIFKSKYSEASQNSHLQKATPEYIVSFDSLESATLDETSRMVNGFQHYI